MKTVLHIIWSSDFGGIETLVFNLAQKQIERNNFEPTIFSATNGGKLFSIAQSNGINIISGNFKKHKPNISSINNCIKLFSHYDILHIHSFNPIICFAAIKSKKPVIYTEHGNFGFHKKLTLLQKLNNTLLKYYLNSSVQVVSFNSEFTKNIAIERYGLTNVNKRVIYNGISSIVENQSIVVPKVNNKLIGTVGRLAKVKKIDRIIRALSQLPPENKITLEVIGDGPELNSLTTLSNELGLDKKIKFRGYQTNVDQFYKNWSLMIVASSGEAFGLVVLEAYKFGVPVAIFKDGGGMIEIVNQVDPQLVLDSEKSLIELLNNWTTLESKYHLDSLTKRRKEIVKSFSIEKTSLEFEKTYNEILCAV